MPKNKNNERKEKIKSFLLKTLHVICYILSIAFIGICVFSGVQSCQKTSKVSAEGLTANNNVSDFLGSYIYSFKYLNEQYLQIPVADQQTLISDYSIIDLSVQYETQQGDKYLVVPLNCYAYQSNGNIVEAVCLEFKITCPLFTDGYSYSYYSYRIERVYFRNGNNYYQTLIASSITSNYYEVQNPFVALVFDIEPIDIEPLLYFYELSNQSNFIFNKNFNYNAPMGVTAQTPYYFKPGNIEGSGVSYYFNYNVGFFISNNEVFNYIRWEWQPSLGAVYYDFGDGNIKKGPDGSEQGSYLYLMYGNSFTNTLKIVNSRDQIAFMPTNSSYAYYYANSSTWVNDNYRNITFLQNMSNDLKTKIESFNNNNQNSFSGNIYVDGGDIFTLLGTAFNSLGDFFGLAILPGISIGVLFFLPLIVGIIVVMFHILKK